MAPPSPSCLLSAPNILTSLSKDPKLFTEGEKLATSGHEILGAGRWGGAGAHRSPLLPEDSDPASRTAPSFGFRTWLCWAGVKHDPTTSSRTGFGGPVSAQMAHPLWPSLWFCAQSSFPGVSWVHPTPDFPHVGSPANLPPSPTPQHNFMGCCWKCHLLERWRSWPRDRFLQQTHQ